jgi:hypothetical protein
MGGDDNPITVFGGIPIYSSPHVPEGQVVTLGGKTYVQSMLALKEALDKQGTTAIEASGALKKLGSIAGLSADFVIHDEWANIEAARLQAVAEGNSGILRRAALKEMERREREQAELEATPGYGSF